MVCFSPEHDFVLPLTVRTMPGVWFLFLPLFLLIMGGGGWGSQDGAGVLLFIVFVTVGRSSQILKSKQCSPLICDIKEGHKASTQAKFH